MMKDNFRISVIMGIYNCAETLPEAIDSLLSQTYQSFKVIMCDDGSVDDTYAVAKAYVDKYDNFILIRNEKNLKLAATLNHCLQYVDTEYIARMDGDDISLPERFEKQIKFLDEHPEYVVVSSPMIYFDETGDWGEGRAIQKPNIYSFKKGTPHAHAPCMLRTKAMKEVDGYTDNRSTIRVEDYYLWYKIYKAGHRGYNLQQPLYKMRDDQNAMSRRTIKTRYNNFLVKKEVLNGLGVPNVFLYALPSLLKAFIPDLLMRKIRKGKMKN